MSDVAQIVKCDRSTVTRHFKHCVAESVRATVKHDAQAAQTVNVISQLNESHETTLDIIEKALEKGDLRVALKALEVEIKQLELTAKMSGQLKSEQRVNFLLSPEYLTLKQVIIEALEPYPEARQRAADALTEAAADGNPTYDDD
ncbi:MAG: hypothetical protein ACXV3E_07560 [Halobacteriota archaeon]